MTILIQVQNFLRNYILVSSSCLDGRNIKIYHTLFIVLRRHEFNEPMDGIVYGVTVSLGFATYENYDYVFRLAELQMIHNKWQFGDHIQLFHCMV